MRISDWSSDVCSSDPSKVDGEVMEAAVNEARRNIATQDIPLLDTLFSLFDIDNIDPDASPDALALRQLAIRRFEQLRSEERRVGKECVSTCRSRWLPSP